MESCLYNDRFERFQIVKTDIGISDKQLEPVTGCAVEHLMMVMGYDALAGTQGRANCAICHKHVVVTATDGVSINV